MLSSPIHKSPGLIVLTPFAAGILLGKQYPLAADNLHFYILPCLAIICLLQLFKIKKRSLPNHLFLLCIGAMMVLFGLLRYQQNDLQNDFKETIEAEYVATIGSSPIAKEKSYRLDLIIDSAMFDTMAYLVNTKIISYIEKSAEVASLLPGNRIHFKAQLKAPTGPLNPEDFDYQAYLKDKKTFATCYISSNNWHLLPKDRYTIRIAAARIQSYVVSLLEDQHYDDEELALISALTVGYKQLIGEEQRQAYVASGATHVLAVSGLHVGIIFLFLVRIFKLFGRSKRIMFIRTFWLIILLWCFAFITGLTPSVTRATVMFSMVALGKLMKLRNNIYNTIFLSAFILLFYNPKLIFDVGFQLSYTALLGIVSFQPPMAKFFMARCHIPKTLAELASVSIAAQIGTAPISIHTFNAFPSYFILTNIWIIPLVTIIVNGAVILILVSLTQLPTLVISAPLGWALKAMNTGVEWISQMPCSLNSFLYINGVSVLLLYLAMVCILVAMNYHSKRYLFGFVLCFLLTLSYNFKHIYDEKDTHTFFVFQDRNSFNIGARQGLKSSFLFNAETEIEMPSYFTQHYLARMNLRADYLNHNYQNYNLILFRDFVLTPSALYAIYSPALEKHSKSFKTTALFINKEEPKSIYILYEHFKFDKLVLHHKPQKHINYYRNFCEKNDIELHLVYQDGAFIAHL